MQTTSLPIQLHNAAAAGQHGNGLNGNGKGSDGSQFGAMLSNEIEQRNAPTPPSAQAPAPRPQAAKPQNADKPARHDEGARPAASQPASAGAAKDANAADDAGKTAQAEDEDAAAGEAPADPASALLALMASLQKPGDDAATAKPDAAAQSFDLLGGARGKRSDTAQLAALQAALTSTAKETGAGAGKTFAAAGVAPNPALGAAGAALGVDDQGAAAGKDGAVDLRALPGGAVKAELKVAPEAEFSLQQARDAALLAAQKEAAPAAAALAPAAPASLAAVQAAATASEQLTARVGTTAWENQVGQKVIYMVGSEEQTASLTLNPPDLGPMQVVLSVSGDQASVTFSANQQEVRQALENSLPRLREMMSESGIALGNATVNSGMQDNRQAQDQSARGQGRGRGNGRDEDMTVGETTVRPARTAVIGDRGMVDTFA